MNRVSTGAGLCALAAAVAGFPIINQFVGQQQAAQASPVLASAVSAAVMAQAEPTIVWYGSHPIEGLGNSGFLLRAWSDGRVEVRGWWWPNLSTCNPGGSTVVCQSPWITISEAAEGLAAKADINADLAVDGKDLASVLSAWGEPVSPGIPPSSCPLNLINP
jgi:hypothetical protein